MIEKFDPGDPKYKKVEDLPEKERGDFVDNADGFVRRSAAELFDEALLGENRALSQMGKWSYKEIYGSDDPNENALAGLSEKAKSEHDWHMSQERFKENERNFPAQLTKWKEAQMNYLKEPLSRKPEEVAKRVIEYLKSISSEEFEMPAEADEFSVADLNKLEKDFPHQLPDEYFRNLDTEACDTYFTENDWSTHVRNIPQARKAIAQSILKVFFEKRTPNEILKFMPGQMASGGFLGWGETFEDTVRDDAAILERLGISKYELAQKLDHLLSPANTSKDQHYSDAMHDVSITKYMGAQTCPCCGNRGLSIFGNFDFQITNKKTGRSIAGPGLIVHLIKDHSFFEGRQSPYRVDPEQLYRVLYES